MGEWGGETREQRLLTSQVSIISTTVGGGGGDSAREPLYIALATGEEQSYDEAGSELETVSYISHLLVSKVFIETADTPGKIGRRRALSHLQHLPFPHAVHAKALREGSPYQRPRGDRPAVLKLRSGSLERVENITQNGHKNKGV